MFLIRGRLLERRFGKITEHGVLDEDVHGSWKTHEGQHEVGSS